jgi:hypothetical protein
MQKLHEDSPLPQTQDLQHSKALPNDTYMEGYNACMLLIYQDKNIEENRNMNREIVYLGEKRRAEM